jgi:phosphotransferase system HPr (HPr) family protein
MTTRELEDSSPRNSTKPDEESHPVAAFPAAPIARVKIEVIDPSGLHMRSAGSFVRTACRYLARIWIRHHDARLDAKSILDVLMAALDSPS